MVTPNVRDARRRRFLLAVAGFALCASLVPFSFRVEEHLETAVHIRGGEAEAVDRELTQGFQSPYVHRLVLGVAGLPNPESLKSTQALAFISRNLRSEPGVSGVLSYLDFRDPLFLPPRGGTLVIVGVQPQERSIESLIPLLRARAGWLEDELRPQFPQIKLQFTGETPLNFDLRKVSADDVNHAEIRALPVTLILLLLAFGGLVATTLPLSVGLLSISMTLGAAALLVHELQLSILIQNLATMLGLGLGIDYALLMVSRFREALAAGESSGRAADIASRQAGRTLLLSAGTVAVGFAALLAVPISEISSIGVAGLLVATMSVILCTCVLPWVLALLGARVNGVMIRSGARWRGRGNSFAIISPQRWRRWGSYVTARPVAALLLASTPLLALAWQARRMTPGLPPGDWLPPTAESVQALHTLEQMDRSGIVQSLRVVLELPPGTNSLSATGWSAASRLTEFFAHDSRSAEVISLPTLSGMSENAGMLEHVPLAIRQSFLRQDGRATLFEVLPVSAVTPTAQIQWIHELRAMDVAKITGLPGTMLHIGGVPALNADYDRIVNETLPYVVTFVICGSLVFLLLGLRSLFAAVKAILLNLLSVGAAFGALVLVFQDGHGSRVLGVATATGAVFPIVPILAFAIVFGLSMDYEIFLVARVLEERRRGLTERAAIIEGLASSASLITSAASIMIAVFSAFMLGNFLVIKMLGFTLTVAVLIDATLVRMIIGPALLQLAGDWNWWPLGLVGSAAAAERAQ